MKTEFTVIANSQLEYWAREFKAIVILKDQSFKDTLLRLISEGIVPVVQLDNSPEEITFLSSLPRKSIIGWCYSDESLDTSFALEISKLGSIVLILRPYHLNPVKARNLGFSMGYLLSNSKNVGSLKDFTKFVLWFLRGISMYRREKKIVAVYKQYEMPYTNFPLGYTDVFCISLLSVFNPKYDDPCSSLMEMIPSFERLPESHLIFVGQVGQVVRKVAINAAKKSESSIVITRTGYGAFDINKDNVRSNGIEYVRLLLSSKFVLCPPGNISGNSFRIHETVIVRRIPIVLSHVVSDPNFVSPVDSFPPKENFRSWNQAISSSKLISKESYDEQAEMNLHCLQKEIEQAKNLILQYSKLAKSIGFIN